MDAEIDGQVASELAQVDVRYTKVRQMLVSVLMAAGGPLTLPEIAERCGEIPTSSLYRNLDVLEQAGVVKRVTAIGDRGYFELAEPLVDHHHHLICLRCGRIIDVDVDESVESAIDAGMAAVADQHRFVPEHHSLDLYGHCHDCALG